MRYVSSPVLVITVICNSGENQDSPTTIRPSGKTVVERLPTTATPSATRWSNCSVVTFGCCCAGGGGVVSTSGGAGTCGPVAGGGGGCGIIRCATLFCVSRTHSHPNTGSQISTTRCFPPGVIG